MIAIIYIFKNKSFFQPELQLTIFRIACLQKFRMKIFCLVNFSEMMRKVYVLASIIQMMYRTIAISHRGSIHS